MMMSTVNGVDDQIEITLKDVGALTGNGGLFCVMPPFV